MKKLLMAAATVALLFATSCKNDVNAPENIQLGENEFLATIDNGAVPQNAPTVRDGMNTMTIIDGSRRVFWQAGDEISINGVGYKAKTTANPVVFEPTRDGETASQGTDGKYHAFYPASIASITGNDNEGILPSEQIYNGANNVSNLPMYACSTTKELTFYNICAVLKIVVPEYFAGATKIEVSSDYRMSGEFYVNNNELCMYFVDSPEYESQRKITIRKSDNAAFTVGEEVYIAVPAYNYTNFTVAAIDGNGAVLWDKTLDECELEVNKIYPVNITYNGLCFTADENNVTVTFNNIPTLYDEDGNEATIEYSTNGTNWGDYESGSTITLDEGDKVYFRASYEHNTAFNEASFVFSGNVKASGNIMSLYGPNCPNIQLPDNAFSGLFQGCVGLLTAPELPATELGEDCYKEMFSNCGNLQKAPKLPATELAANCYANMFEHCGLLNEVWIYATDVNADDGCLSDWLNDAGADEPNRTVHCKTGMGSSLNIPQGWNIDDTLQ